ncbi:MAG: hypothetical protein HOI47_16405 [Candidatus Scalindua sp.]|jgi:hypothetical protein|nr:hypothetical protein [Candidatus Scalindua sp.]
MDLKKAERKIRNTLIMNCIISVILVVALIVLYSSGEDLEMVYIYIGCVFIICGLTFGVYKRSRICISTIFIYLLLVAANRLYNVRQLALGGENQWADKSVLYIIFYIALLYFTFEGMRGTFAYHKLKKQERGTG